MEYVKKYTVQSSEVDPFYEMKLSSLFLLMQDIATKHAEEIGIGFASIIQKNMYWVITRYSIDVNRMPKYSENIVVKTYTGSDMKFMFPRYFEIKSENGETLIKASSMWCILSKDTHRVVMNPFDGKVIPPTHYDGEEPLPKKVDRASALNLVDERKVRYSDIDLNSHVNNTRYIEYLSDVHNIDFYQKNVIKHITINYEKELMNRDTIKLYSSCTNPEIITGKVEDKIIFDVEIEYKNRG